MANSYFNHSANRVPAGVRARADHINNVADEIAAAFDKIPDQTEIINGLTNFAPDTGTANSCVVDLKYPPSTLTVGMMAAFTVAESNTAAATLNLNGLGAKALRHADGSDLRAGDLAVGQVVEVRYNGTEWRIVSQTPKLTTDAINAAAEAKASAAEAAASAALSAGKYTTSEYCPGYPPVFDGPSQFHIAGVDVTNLFNVGRRLKFLDGELTLHGVITASSFGTNTDITMQMDSGQSLSSALTEVCMVTGTAAWSPILTDNNPLAGSPINAITSGRIGLTEWWVAVGDFGRLMTSTDAGLTWTERNTGITEDLLSIGYSERDEQFIAGGLNGQILISTDGSTWTTGNVGNAAEFTGTRDVRALVYGNITADGWYALIHASDIANRGAFTQSIDQGASWTGAILNLDYMDGAVAADYSPDEDYWLCGGDQLYGGVDMRSMSSIAATLSAPIRSLAYIHPSKGAVLGLSDGGLMVTADPQGNASWSAAATNPFGASSVNGIAHSRYLNKLVAVGDNAKIAVSDDNGNNWSAVSNGFFPTSRITDVHFSEQDLIFVAVSSAGEVCRSTLGDN